MEAAIKHHNDGRDRISELPEDILISSIINRLSFREATATSVLSTRWRYLHTYVTHLDLPPFKPNVHSKKENLYHYVESEILHERKRFLEHVNMINGVLDSHRGGVGLKELRLCMYRMRMKACNMEKWVQFALTKDNIEIIDIKLPHLPIRYSNFHPSGRYCFGLSQLMTTTKSLTAIKCLKQLTLHCVKVSDLDFDILISNFLALETVSIRDTFSIKKATVMGHPKLMHLEIPCQSLEIRNLANLVSLRVWYLPSEATIEMENIPKLTQFYSCERYTTLQHPTLYSKIPSHIRDQLQAIHLQSAAYRDSLNGTLPPPFQFVNVKHLELEVQSMLTHDRGDVFKFRSLIVGCSSLEKLKIKLWTGVPAYSIKFGKRFYPYGYYRNKLSPKLKVLEMEGYAGSHSEFQLAALVTCYAINLERVIVVACDAASERIRQRSLARAQEDFRLITPPSVHLQFI